MTGHPTSGARSGPLAVPSELSASPAIREADAAAAQGGGQGAGSVAALKALVLAAVQDRKGVAPKLLDVTALTDLTDAMLIVGGTSGRHVEAIVDHVLERAKAQGHPVLGVEGRAGSDWVLLDFADVVVHVMRAQARAFYDLERLWQAHAPPLPGQSEAPVPHVSH